MTAARPAWWQWAALALMAALLAFNFAGYPLLDPDEGRNAEVMREMAATNGYLLPRLGGLPYLDKPIVYFAAGAAFMELLGPTALAARLPSLLFTLGTLLVVAWFARRRWGSQAAWIAAIATAATPFTLAYSRTVIFDAAVMFWVVAALVAFHEAIEARASPALYRLIAWAAMALGVLTKGPVALAVPLLVAVPFALWRRRGRALVDITSVLLFLALVLPWVYAVSRTVPDFLPYVIRTETLGRLTTSALGRDGAWWYFLVMFPAAALPWSIVVAAWAVQRLRERSVRRDATHVDHTIVYLVLWVTVPLVFFSLSQSKRPQYVLPLVPAVALLAAAVLIRAARPGLPAAGGFLALLGGGLLVARERLASWVPATPEIAAAIPGTALALGAVCLVAGAAAWTLSRWPGPAILALMLPVVTIPFASVALMDAIGRHRSAEPLAQALDPVLAPTTEVVAIETFPQSLPFYLNRTVTLVTRDGAELTSNYLIQRYARWARVPESPFRPLDWWREAVLTCRRPRVFVVASPDVERRRWLGERMPLVADTGRHAAYGPCGGGDLAGRGPWRAAGASRRPGREAAR